jgi:hypothetical protein
MNSKLLASKVTARFNSKRRLPDKLPHGLRDIFKIYVSRENAKGNE